MIARRVAAAIALCFPVLLSAAGPAPRERLDALHERMERLRSALAESESDRSEAREELRASERAISAANRKLRELAEERAAATAKLRSLSAQRAELQAAIAAREHDLARLLAGLYMSGNPGYAKLVLSGQDPNQTARELHYIAYLSRAHAGLAESLRGELDRLRATEGELQDGSARITAIEQSERAGRSELLREQAERRKTLTRVSDRIRAQSREVKSLERDEARLSKLVDEIARAISTHPKGVRNEGLPQPGGAGEFAALKGRLRLPVRGVLVHRFGTTRPGGGPPWKGLFIQSQPGQEVRAVAAGQVVFADWMRGYGNLLILDHGAGYLTIYANNESLLKEIGDRVGAAESIAIVGASGGGQETGLYFEARHEGKAFDPLTWAKLR